MRLHKNYLFLIFLMTCISQLVSAGPILDRIKERRAARAEKKMEDGSSKGMLSIRANIQILRDVPYGRDKMQRMDVYSMPQIKNAPIIFMVHGGAWRMGDKDMDAVVENKVAHWVPMGFVFISTNYRMLPDADPIEQASDIVRAFNFAREKAPSWGGDPKKIILMGHSAGAHLVSLISADRSLAPDMAWLGTISLDSAAFNVETIMDADHYRLYDIAFGKQNRPYWRAASPFYALSGEIRPLLAVCSTQREDPCPQAQSFAEKARSFGAMVVTIIRKDFSHKEINKLLGKDTAYTKQVESFMASLDKSIAERLGR